MPENKEKNYPCITDREMKGGFGSKSYSLTHHYPKEQISKTFAFIEVSGYNYRLPERIQATWGIVRYTFYTNQMMACIKKE